jgi:hypothetical protein
MEPPELPSATPDDLLESPRILPRRAKEKGDASFGACMVVCSVDESYFNRAARTPLDFRTKSVAEIETCPFLIGFPHPLQLLLVDEIRGFNQPNSLVGLKAETVVFE